jgi:DNA-binding IclR family transcriptional regulator
VAGAADDERSVLGAFFHQHLRELATNLGETSHFAVREGGQAFFVAHHTPTGQVVSVAGQTGELARCIAPPTARRCLPTSIWLI